MRLRFHLRLLFLSVLVAVLVGACSGGDVEGDSPTTTPGGETDTTAVIPDESSAGELTNPPVTVSPDEALPATGRILVSSGPITGHRGHVLLVFGPHNESEICAQIDSDSWTLTERPLTDRSADADPCTGSMTDTFFESGDYALTASIFEPGSRTALSSTAAQVELGEGDARLELDGSKLSFAAEGNAGRINVTVSDITGQAGKYLIVIGQNNAATMCAAIDDDPWSMSTPATLREMPGGDGGPCGEGTPEVLFPAGDTRVTAAVVIPGNQSPEATLETVVSVDGDVTVTIDGARLSG